MEIVWIVSVLAVLVVVGNALLLLKTAKKPKLPDSVKPDLYKNDDDGGW